MTTGQPKAGMRPIQMLWDEALIAQVDAAAAESHESRSAFIRAAVQAELKRRKNAALVEAHRKSYLEQPDDDAWHPSKRGWGDGWKES